MKLGFIGLGVMGRPMALNLMKHGHDMAVYARRAESAKPLVDEGARFCASPAEVAGQSEIVFTMVTASSDVEQVVLGDNGLVHGADRGCVLVDMETISPTVAREIAVRLRVKEIDMLDAPVSGGPVGAQQASLSIMVGGEAAVFERVRPLFSCLGKTVVHMGPSGSGQMTKACNQLVLLVTAQGAAEALTLARRSGLDPVKVREVMLGGIPSSRVLELFGKRMVDRDFSAGIETRLYHKDLAIVLGIAHELGQGLPAAAVVMQHVNAAIGSGWANEDLSSILKTIERLGPFES
ncbi:MAG: NAD(P)-dependent oxidoreductase [Burkholderiales bacterium]